MCWGGGNNKKVDKKEEKYLNVKIYSKKRDVLCVMQSLKVVQGVDIQSP